MNDPSVQNQTLCLSSDAVSEGDDDHFTNLNNDRCITLGSIKNLAFRQSSFSPKQERYSQHGQGNHFEILPSEEVPYENEEFLTSRSFYNPFVLNTDLIQALNKT